MKVVDLRTSLERRGLDTSGLKKVLQKRLTAVLAEEDLAALVLSGQNRREGPLAADLAAPAHSAAAAASGRGRRPSRRRRAALAASGRGRPEAQAVRAPQPRVLGSPSAPSPQPAPLVQPWPSPVKAMVRTFGHAGSILWYWRCINTRDSNGFMLAVAAATKSTGFSFGAKPAAGAAGPTLAIPSQSPGAYLWARRFYPLILAVFKHARL